jgi:hypothetical protein
MSTQVSAYVRSRLRGALPEAVALEAISALTAAQFPLVEPGSILEQRVHLAIVKLVCDPWSSSHEEPRAEEKFDSALKLAATDWRDLLVSAGLEHENWPEVLEEAGYQAPSRL